MHTLEDQNVPLDRLTFLQGTPFPPLCPLFSFSPGEEKKEDKEKEEEEEEEERTNDRSVPYLFTMGRGERSNKYRADTRRRLFS